MDMMQYDMDWFEYNYRSNKTAAIGRGEYIDHNNVHASS